MIPKTCETCELHSCYQRHANKPCHDWAPDLGKWNAKIAALEAEVAHAWEAESASVARLESELGGLRHSLAEVEDERDEAVSAMAEWRARAEVAEPERDRERARAEAYRAALLEANRRRKLAIARSAEVFRMLIFRAEAAEARERKLNALGFERPGPDAYTCGDALGLRRMPEGEPSFHNPEADSEEIP